jgi:hypothetical protein
MDVTDGECIVLAFDLECIPLRQAGEHGLQQGMLQAAVLLPLMISSCLS